MNTLVSLLFLSVLASTSAKKNITRDNSFDIYIFTLHWPFTTCLDWMESGKGHQCSNIGKNQGDYIKEITSEKKGLI